ncbi:unnamed protein product [Malus baccata var. baccata]
MLSLFAYLLVMFWLAISFYFHPLARCTAVLLFCIDLCIHLMLLWFQLMLWTVDKVWLYSMSFVCRWGLLLIRLLCTLRFCTRSLLHESLDYSLIDEISGRQNDRETLLGELNWIFTAVTDTIAWNVLPHGSFPFPLTVLLFHNQMFRGGTSIQYSVLCCRFFQRLFRQDLLVASLFRNFLLADRIMRSAHCSPISHPMLPSTHQHHVNYQEQKEATLFNGFDNHDFPDKGISKLCLVNELDDSLLLLQARFYTTKKICFLGQQKLVTAFSSIQGHKPGVRSLNAVVDWEQQSGYLSTSRVHEGQLAAGFVDGSVRLYDVRTPEM